MPSPKTLVINTGPILALVAAMGDLKILSKLYRRVIVPREVCDELGKGGKQAFGSSQFNAASFLEKRRAPIKVNAMLQNSLDPGEAAVIQLALEEEIATVCIDETAGRRMARLFGLELTGSLGILLRAKKEGLIKSLKDSTDNMRKHGIYLSDRLLASVLVMAGESGRKLRKR